jgi:hypothetical protein
MEIRDWRIGCHSKLNTFELYKKKDQPEAATQGMWPSFADNAGVQAVTRIRYRSYPSSSGKFVSAEDESTVH